MPAHPQQKSLSPNLRDWQRLMRKKNRVLVAQGLFIKTLQKCVDEEKQRWISSLKLEKKTQVEGERLKEDMRVAKEDSRELAKVNKKFYEEWKLDIEDAKGFYMEEAKQYDEARKSGGEKDKQIAVLSEKIEETVGEEQRLLSWGGISDWDMGRAKWWRERVERMERQLEEAKISSERLERQTKVRETEIEEAKKSSGEKDIKIVGLSGENERFRAEVDRLQAQASARETEMEEARKTGEKKGLKIAELHGVNEALEGIVERLYGQAEANVEEMELQQQKWQATDTLCNQLCARVARMNVEERERQEREVLWCGEELAARDERIEELEEGDKVVQTRLAEALERGREMEAKIAELEERGEWWECDEMDTDVVT